MNNVPHLCCEKCGSLNVNPGIPQTSTNKLTVYCNDCGAQFDIDIKIEGVSDDGVLQVTYMPSLILIDKDKDRIKKYY